MSDMGELRRILCLNAGSSSLKYAVFQTEGSSAERLTGGVVEEIGSEDVPDHRQALTEVFERLRSQDPNRFAAVGHRVVHGGARYFEPVRIDDSVRAYLNDTIRLAPEHQPAALAGIDAVSEIDSEIPQVACFDTAFHQAMPERAKRLPLPEEFWESGVRRYGFHGLSYHYVRDFLGDEIPPRTIIAHLGNGSSMVALLRGNPIDTTMGFTPNSGLMMGSRCGDLGSGVVLYLLRQEGYAPDEISDLLNEGSGLLGVSGISSDMRQLLDREEESAAARRAIELFCYSVRKHLGGLAAALGGLDLLVFTGGIGEHAAPIRERIVEGLEFLDFDSRVIETDEELVLARETARHL